MNRKSSFAAIFLLATALLLTACGFHLRGSRGEANLPFMTIFVGLPQSSTLGAELKRSIRSTGNTEVVSERKDAQVALDVLGETTRRDILSLNSQGRVREYSLVYVLNFQVKDQQGNLLLPPTVIEQRRTLAYNEAEALAKETEAQMLYRDMQSDIVQQVLRRLTAIKIPPPAAANPVDATRSTGAAK